MDEELYRHQLRNHFIGQVKNPKLEQKSRLNYLTELPTQQIKEQALKAQQKIHELQANVSAKQRNLNQALNSGGDADRMLCYSLHQGGESFRQRNMSDNYITAIKQLQTNPKPSAAVLTSNSSRKYLATTSTLPVADDSIGDHRFLYENDSNFGGVGNGSEDSAKSQKSSKTVVSRKSSQDLRKIVTSQCKLHEVIDETLKQMCNTEIDSAADNNAACGLQEQPSTHYPLTLSQCKRCTERMHAVQSQKDVMTEIGKGDFLDCRNNGTLTISVDDVVNSKVINPMIRKLQRMYLNNLKEEMSLMEDLERLPLKVNEVYKSIIFKPKD